MVVLGGVAEVTENKNYPIGGEAYSSVVTIPNVAIRYVSRYLGHDAIRIAILVYRVSQCLDLQQQKQFFFYCKHP